MKITKITKTVGLTLAALTMMLSFKPIVEADKVVNRDNQIQEIIVKGTVVKAEDVCGIIAKENIYIIPCDQVQGFDDKMVNVIGMVTEEGDVQTIDATSVQTIE
ncbi:MAG: hypothetical protein HQK72_12540 [Desulfamplus sp.]|nr:hypothetical protein [Desulfamplus sp.]